MSDFLVKRDDLRECRVAESEAPALGAGPGAAAGRDLRPDREQRHLRGDGRGDVLLGLLPGRGRLGAGADVGLRRGRAQRGRRGRAGDARLRLPAPLLAPGGDARPRPASSGFVDGSPHRAALPSAYHRYLASAADPFYRRRHRGRPDAAAPALLHLVPDRRPARRRGARRAAGRSSSPAPRARRRSPPRSCWRQRQGVELVGLTSPRNAEFVDGLGIYGRAVTYDAIDVARAGPADLRRHRRRRRRAPRGPLPLRRRARPQHGRRRHPLGGARAPATASCPDRRRPSSSPPTGSSSAPGTGAAPASRRAGRRRLAPVLRVDRRAGSSRSTARASRRSRAPTSTSSRAASSPSTAHVISLV